MGNYYLVPDLNNPLIKKVEFKSVPPVDGLVVPVDPSTGLPEEVAWLQVVQINDPEIPGGQRDVVAVNSELKSQVLAAKTAALAASNLVATRKKKRLFGEALIDKIATMNDAKGLTIEQVDAFMSNATLQSLREHLWAGNIDTFISKLQAADVSAFFSSEEKSLVVSECQAFLASL